MRHSWRLTAGTKGATGGIALGMLFTLSACTLPDITADKQSQRGVQAGPGFFSHVDDHAAATDVLKSGKTYLATVHVQFAGTGSPSFNFDVHRDRRDLISADMAETEHTSTYLHMGYSHEEGGIAGLRFTLRF